MQTKIEITYPKGCDIFAQHKTICKSLFELGLNVASLNGPCFASFAHGIFYKTQVMPLEMHDVVLIIKRARKKRKP